VTTTGAAAQTTAELEENNGRHSAFFCYPSVWTAYKYDDEQDPANTFYRNRMKPSSSLSAVDFIAHDQALDTLVAVECKDFRGATPDNLPRLSDLPSADENTANQWIKNQKLKVRIDRAKPFLPKEFAKNVRDTLTGLVAAARANDPALGHLAHLAVSGKPMVCVLVLELDPPAAWLPGEAVRLFGRLKHQIERELSFLDHLQVVIWSSLSPLNPNPYAWSIRVSP
jgi:hypothetical protein